MHMELFCTYHCAFFPNYCSEPKLPSQVSLLFTLDDRTDVFAMKHVQHSAAAISNEIAAAVSCRRKFLQPLSFLWFANSLRDFGFIQYDFKELGILYIHISQLPNATFWLARLLLVHKPATKWMLYVQI